MNAEDERGWWSRNGLWAVPLGCVGCLGLVAVVIAGSIYGLFWSFRSNDLYERATAIAKEHPRAIELLGEPMEIGFGFSGNIAYDSDSARADISLPISGPDGSGSLSVVGHKEDGAWVIDRLELSVGETTVDLLDGATTGDVASALTYDGGLLCSSARLANGLSAVPG